MLRDLAAYGNGTVTVSPLDDEFPGVRNVWRAELVTDSGARFSRFGFGPIGALRALRSALEFRADILRDQVRRGSAPILPESLRLGDRGAVERERARVANELLS